MRKLMSMTTIAAITTAATLLSSGVLLRAADETEGTSKTEQPGQLSRKDYKFACEAAQGGLLEVKLGELAKQKASNPTVQQFADRMIADHNKANDQLKQIA